MKIISKATLFAFILLFAPLYIFSQDIPTGNRVINENIKTILVYPADAGRIGNVHPVGKSINDPVPLILTFDEVKVDVANVYQAKVYHCNADWQISNLKEREYLNEYNEFNINNYEFSANEKIPYTHFRFQIPSVKVPGNYLLMVYKDYDESNIAFTQRFFVYDEKVGVSSNISPLGPGRASTEHQVEFAIDYSKYPVQDPLNEIKVVIRQNQRWDNVLTDLKPSFIHHDTRELIFRNFNLSNNFKSGNEFRFFDLRSVDYPMQNVNKIEKSDLRYDAYLMRDKFRGYEAYSMINDDLNGSFFIENKDYAASPQLESEYVYVHFYLEIPDQVRDDIYVVGKLTNWKTGEDNKMRLIEGSDVYTCQLLLKQGFYDYQYLVPGFKENPNIIEGNHFETNNEYEIMVYYHHPVFRSDILIGYKRVSSE